VIGERLSHFLILEPLGAGGMGVVYRAHDETLEREVAIKVLPAGALADESARKQFRKEARALSKLNHLNIAMIFELGSERGVDFLVLELVRGGTLSDQIVQGPIPEAEIARLGEQLANGLAAAHDAGILHRDIKPGNLGLTADGNLKILDFGLAKLSRAAGDRSITQTASLPEGAVGTLPYMPPEQIRGGPVNARSDLYAAGAVLYEMACGRRAFPQASAAGVIEAVLNQRPTAPREIAPRVSMDLERIILRCLEKDPARRYAAAANLASDLKQLALPTQQRRFSKQARMRHKAAVTAGVSVVLIAALASIGLNAGGLRDRIFGAAVPAVRSLAVLPLTNLSRDPNQDYFADGMTDELISRLAQVSALRVVSGTSSMHYKRSSKPLREIANELKVGMIVEGSVRSAGSQVRITARLVDAPRDRPLWSESFERTLTNVLALQSEVAQALVKRIAVQLTPQERDRIAAVPNVDPEAHKEYLRGRFDYNRFAEGQFQSAIDHFNRAIEIDPGYAAPYAGLADAYCALSSQVIPANEAMPQARAAAAKALEIDPGLAAAHVSRAYVLGFYDFNWKASEEEFRRAIALNSNEVTAHQFYAQLLIVNGRTDEAAKEIGKARDLDPLSPFIATMQLWPGLYGHHYDEVIRRARELTASDPKNSNNHLTLGLALMMKRQYPQALASLRKSYELEPRPLALAWIGCALARAGRRQESLHTLAELRDLSRRVYVQPYTMAVVFANLGETDSAFAWLDRGLDQRSEEMIEAKVGTGMDPLRGDPRFQRLLRRMSL